MSFGEVLAVVIFVIIAVGFALLYRKTWRSMEKNARELSARAKKKRITIEQMNRHS